MRDGAMQTDYYKKYEPVFGAWRIVRETGAGAIGKRKIGEYLYNR